MITDKPNLKDKTNTPKRKGEPIFILEAESVQRLFVALGVVRNGSSSEIKASTTSPI
jgi:hypothetical protein